MTIPQSFWARRRAAVQAEAAAEARVEMADDAAKYAEAQPSKDDAELLQELGLPDPDGMEAGDDFTAFLAKEVPEHLKNKALRMLWRSNPVLACVDGLNEYDDDYRAAMLLAEPIKTAYQVGKGMMAHLEEVARQQDAAEHAVDEAENQEVEDREAVEEDMTEPSVAESAPQETAQVEVGEAVEIAVAPQRMRFRFEEAQA